VLGAFGVASFEVGAHGCDSRGNLVRHERDEWPEEANVPVKEACHRNHLWRRVKANNLLRIGKGVVKSSSGDPDPAAQVHYVGATLAKSIG
jgi:hypothetical protein